MRLRHKKNAEIKILSFDIVINSNTNINSSFDNHIDLSNDYLDYEKIFGNNNKLYLELGMGKGKFIIDSSMKFKDINYIGIEKSATIVLKAIDKLSKDNTDNLSLSYPNLKFMVLDIINIDKFFSPHSIDRIYLNFSDPWPKKRHESRRLVHNDFLTLYEKILKKDSELHFKTDNKLLFDFALSEIENSNFKLLEYTYDLHNDCSMNSGNIMTEYEEKFSKKGNKICKLIAKI